jgi:hypothetical protein
MAFWKRTIFKNCFGDVPIKSENVRSNCFLLKNDSAAKSSIFKTPLA